MNTLPSLPAAGRYGGLSFSINDKSYIGCGAAAKVPTSQTLSNFWELSWVDIREEPPVTMEEKTTIRVISNEDKVDFILEKPLESNADFYVCDLGGKKIYSGPVYKGEMHVEIKSSAFARGIYCYMLFNSGSKPVAGKFYH